MSKISHDFELKRYEYWLCIYFSYVMLLKKLKKIQKWFWTSIFLGFEFISWIWFMTLINFSLRNYLKHLLEKTVDILFRARVSYKLICSFIILKFKTSVKNNTLRFFFHNSNLLILMYIFMRKWKQYQCDIAFGINSSHFLKVRLSAVVQQLSSVDSNFELITWLASVSKFAL